MKLSEELQGHSLYVSRTEINSWVEQAIELEQENIKWQSEHTALKMEYAELEQELAIGVNVIRDYEQRIAELERQADCPYTHMIDDICTKCGWQGREALGKEIDT